MIVELIIPNKSILLGQLEMYQFVRFTRTSTIYNRSLKPRRKRSMQSGMITKILGVLSLALFVLTGFPTASVAVEAKPLTYTKVCAEASSAHTSVVNDPNEHHHTSCFGSMAHCLIAATTISTLCAPRPEPTSGTPRVAELRVNESRVLVVKSPPPRF
mgnify:CR=1 FL=1